MSAGAPLSRRTVLTVAGASVAGLGMITLAGCSPSNGGTDSSEPPSTEAGVELAKLADVAVGSTLAVTSGSTEILLARPEENTVVAFSAICTHQGCIVAAAGTEFDCPCHGSRFEAATGAVLNGPARRPLNAIPVAIAGDAIVTA